MFKKALKWMVVFSCIFSFFVFAPMALAVTIEDWRDYAASGFLAGDGTQGDPYLISTPQELAYLSKQVSEGTTYAGEYFRVVKDIDLGAHQWWPIGKGILEAFHGNFDGDNWTISNLKIGAENDPPYFSYGGLFGYIDNNASLKNIKLTGVQIYFEENNVGALVGYINSSGVKVSNCHSSGKIVMSDDVSANVGGLVGESYGTIENSSSQVVITGFASGHVGGLVGEISGNGVVNNSSGHGNVSGIRYTGGLAGKVNSGGVVKNSFATGKVSGTDILGGLVGYNQGEVLNCYVTGEIEKIFPTASQIGGLVGFHSSSGTIKNSYVTGDINGFVGLGTGGLVGSCSGYIENSFCANVVLNGNGFVGELNITAIIANCFWDTTLTPAGHASATGKTTAQMKDDAFCGELNLYVAGQDSSWAQWQRLPEQRPTLMTAQDYLIKRNGVDYGRGLTALKALMADLNAGIEDIELVVPQGQTPGIIAYDQGLTVPAGTVLNLKLNGYTLDVENPVGVGITIGASCQLILNGPGILNATGNGEGGHGFLASSGAVATLTNARAKGANSHGVYATEDSNITLNGSAVACGNDGHGVYAEGDGIQILAMGNAIAHGNSGKGVFCTEISPGDEINITIEKNALAFGENSTAAGVSGANMQISITKDVRAINSSSYGLASYGGSITVEGAIYAAKYINVDDFDKNIGDGVLVGNYFEYSSNPLNENVVKVKARECHINGIAYNTFQAALDTIGATQKTITLLKNINITGQVLVDNKNVMVDTNSFTLSVNNPVGSALEVRNGGKFLLAENSNGGEVNVVGNGVGDYWGTGVMVMHSGSEAVVTNASGTGYLAFGAFAYQGAKVTVKGNASASGTNIMAGVESSGSNSLAIIEGNVIVSGHHYSPAFSQYFNFFGVRAASGGNIIVEGNIVVSSTDGIVDKGIGITGDPVEPAGVENSVVVEGTVTANTLVEIGEQAKTLADATRQNGYYEFSYTSGGTFIIKIKDPGYIPPINPPSGGGGGGGAEFIIITQTADGRTVTSTKISASTSGGKASSGASAAIIQALLDKAKAAQKNGGSPRDNILVEVDAPENITELDFTITRAALTQIKNDTKGGFGVASPLVSVSFDNKAIDTITKAGTGNNIVVSAGIVGEEQLSQKDREKVKGRPVYSFSVKTGDTYVSHFGGGFATVSMPYTLRAGENPNAVIVYYLDEKGSLKTIRGRYDKGTGQVVFKTPHFSQFIIGHNAVAFEDVAASAWYKPAVDFIAARGITTGIDSKTFAPGATLNRGQFIVMLMRAYGLEPEADPADNFSDAGNDYYTGYLASAKALGITKGAGNNLYLPNAKITREEMFTLLYRSLEVIGELPAASSSKAVSDFNDASQISSYAKDAFESLVAGGVISGSNGALNPKGNASRGEMAQILFNLLSK